MRNAVSEAAYAALSYCLISYIYYFTIIFFPFTMLMPFCILLMR